jgi:thiamine pyrophosphate-dependent acetolactate synthase large subunit-like protein
MSLRLRPAQEADSAKIGSIGRDAFQGTLSSALFPPHLYSKSELGDPALDEAQWRAARNSRRMKDGKPTFVVIDVPEDGSDAEVVVGFAQWDTPSQAPPAASEAATEADLDPSPGSLDQEELRKLYKVIEEETKKALGPDGSSKMWCKVP